MSVQLSAVLAFTLAIACQPPAPAVQATPAAPTTAPAPPPPAAPPRCEALSEGCAAQADTELAVPSALRFRPPVGWHFAAEPTQATARSADGKALLAFAAASGDPERREERARILSRIEALVAGLGVTGVDFPRLEKRLKKPDTKIAEAGSFPIGLWEVGEEQQQGKAPLLAGTTPGTVLVVMSETPVGLLLVGAAFVTPEVATEQAPRIMDSVKSLRLVEPNSPSGGPPAADGPAAPPAVPGAVAGEAVKPE